MQFSYRFIADSTLKHMVIATEALKLAQGQELAPVSLLGAGFLLRQRCFTSLFPCSAEPELGLTLFPVGSSRPSRGTGVPRPHGSSTGAQPRQGNSPGSKPWSSTCKGREWITGTPYLPKKKKKPTEQAYQLTSVTYDQNSANAKYPISMLLLSKESLEFGLFHRQSVCAISEAKRKSGRGARCS